MWHDANKTFTKRRHSCAHGATFRDRSINRVSAEGERRKCNETKQVAAWKRRSDSVSSTDDRDDGKRAEEILLEDGSSATLLLALLPVAVVMGKKFYPVAEGLMRFRIMLRLICVLV